MHSLQWKKKEEETYIMKLDTMHSNSIHVQQPCHKINHGRLKHGRKTKQEQTQLTLTGQQL